ANGHAIIGCTFAARRDWDGERIQRGCPSLCRVRSVLIRVQKRTRRLLLCVMSRGTRGGARQNQTTRHRRPEGWSQPVHWGPRNEGRTPGSISSEQVS